MELGFQVNGVRLDPGAATVDSHMREAGLCRLGLWQRLTHRVPRGATCWEAADPLVECFDGQLSIYPCLDGYLTPDRRWHTRCVVLADGPRLTGVEVQVIEGVYAAGNLYDRFLDIGVEHLGPPQDEGHGNSFWQHDGRLVTARYDRHLFNAVFRVEVDRGLPRA